MPKPDGIFVGTPIWIDLSTSNIDASRAFYSALFGWNVPPPNEQFGGYTMMDLDGALIAGAMPKGPDEAGMPDAWTIYLASDDAAASVEAAKAAGGAILLDAMDVADFGRMAIVADPAGAVFGIWQPNTHKGFGAIAEASAPAWFELQSRNFAASRSFLKVVFGVEADDIDMGPGGPAYATIKGGGEDRMGIMDATGVLPDGVPSMWSVYFGVRDTDAAVAKAEELGGATLRPAEDTPFGRFAVLADSTGAPFMVVSVHEGEA